MSVFSEVSKKKDAASHRRTSSTGESDVLQSQTCRSRREMSLRCSEEKHAEDLKELKPEDLDTPDVHKC